MINLRNLKPGTSVRTKAGYTGTVREILSLSVTVEITRPEHGFHYETMVDYSNDGFPVQLAQEAGMVIVERIEP